MSWRVVVISNSAKLDYKMDYMIVRQDCITKIHLSEISLLLIESTAVSLTSYLLCELTKRKIKIIFCDEKRNPSSELIGYYGSHDTSLKVKKQMEWTSEIKAFVWTEIVAEKIRNQKLFLEDINRKEANLLEGYILDMHIGDTTNREGHAAKVYFNAVFGMKFSRTSEVPVNSALNYGYSILLSAFNREITANGYITQVGLFHDNMFNQFNLGSDFMEPFRILVDRCVYEMNSNKFEHEEKMNLVNLLNNEVFIDGKRNYVNNAIKIYCRSVLDAINENDVSLIRFYRNEL
ncbi:MAG: type II CRISPR-associated endonuclease Cas1 [Clostridium sp.]|uniref:type II CRISPR-associated endonuclease Cas1 n=1 Tax=Clostridium sp. TaxID=1506 RepID=UPI003065A27D